MLIQLCLKQDYTAQEFLYKKYAPRFLALILRYIPRRDDAEDVLVESIFKIFTKLDTFKKEGSFEGWMKRLVVNDCLMFLRKNKMITVGIDTLNEAKADLDDSFIMEKDVEALKRVIDSLPIGYKIIFQQTKIKGRNVLGGIILGIPNYFSLFYLIKMLEAKAFQSATLFTINNIAIVILTSLVGMLFF